MEKLSEYFSLLEVLRMEKKEKIGDSITYFIIIATASGTQVTSWIPSSPSHWFFISFSSSAINLSRSLAMVIILKTKKKYNKNIKTLYLKSKNI